jgi:hypothetical protein
VKINSKVADGIGLEVMDLDDDEDEWRDVGEGALSKDSGRKRMVYVERPYRPR